MPALSRDSPSLVIVPALQAEGASVRAYDPEGMKEAKALLDDVAWCDDAYSTLDGADALVLVTEWNEFRALDLERVRTSLKTPVIIDLRNIYRPEDMADAGFHYVSVGREAVRPSPTERHPKDQRQGAAG